MKKDEALQRITAIENETKELRRIINQPDRKGSIIERVVSYETACEERGIDPYNSLPYPHPQTEQQRQINNTCKKITVVDTLNEGVKIDWRNKKQEKWENRFYLNEDGGLSFGSSIHYDGFWGAGSCSSSAARLSLVSKPLAEHFGRNFMDLHKIDFNL